MKWLLIRWSTDTEIFSPYTDLMKRVNALLMGFSNDRQPSQDHKILDSLSDDYSVCAIPWGSESSGAKPK